MAVKAAVVTGTITGSGYTDFESAGFGIPDAAIVFLSLANTGTNPNAAARPCIGFWDGTTQYSVATNAGDAIDTSDTHGLAAAYAAQLYTDRLWSISNISGGNGVRLSWVSGTALSINLYVTVVLLGGLTNKQVGVQDLGTGTSAINVTAPNFRADLVFLATIAKDGTGTRDGARLAFGAAHLNSSDVASQGSVSYYSEDAQGAMKTGCLVRDDKALAVSASDAEPWNVSVGAYSTGFSLTPSANAGNADAYYLAIELPDPDDAHVVVDAAYTSTGNDAHDGAGFEPVVLLLAGGVTSSVNTVTQEGAIWFGAGTESAQRSVAICDEDAQAFSDTESYCATDKILHIRLDTGVADAEATLGSFDADGWTLNYSDAASSAWKYLAIAIGASTGGATTTEIPIGALTLTGYAPTTQTAVRYSLIPTGSLTLTGYELTSLVQSGAITSDIPRADLSLTGYAPDSQVYVARTYLPRGDLTLTGLALESVLGVARSYVPRGDLTLTGYAPTSTAAVDSPSSVPTGALALTGYPPTSLLGVAASLIPTGTLSLTGNVPVTAVRVDKSLIPLATLVLTGYAPTSIGGAAILAPKRGGGVGRRWRKLLYRGRVYKTRTPAEEAQLLNALLAQAEAALAVAQEEAQPTARLAQRKADITRMLKQRRRAEAEVQRELQRLLDDDEEVLLLIGRAWRH